MASSLETTSKESAVKDTGDEVFVCPVATNFIRTQFHHRLTTKELKLDVADAVSLRCANPVFPTAIPGGLEPPLGIMLYLEQYLCSGGLEICNGMCTVQLGEPHIPIGSYHRSPPLGLVAQELSHGLRQGRSPRSITVADTSPDSGHLM